MRGFPNDGVIDKRITVVMSQAMLDQLRAEAQRQDRSISWLLRKAWELSQEKLKQVPAAPNGD